MAKSNLSVREKEIWNSIYGTSRGPTPGRLKILVEEFRARGLEPAMMRIGDEMFPYEPKQFHEALLEAFSNKDDDQVQAYYHPVDCERVVGSSATTWTQWGRLVFEVEGLVPKDAGDDHPVLKENLPRLRLPTEVREALLNRSVSTASVCRLVSLRVVVFFVAAQYEAWSTAAEVAQVTPFKEVIRKQGFLVRDVIVRKDDGLDDVLRDLDPATAVRQPYNAPVAAPAVDSVPVWNEPPVSPTVVIEEIREVFGVTPPAIEVVPEEDAIEAEIRATEARLANLRKKREEARLAARKRDHLAARVTDVTFDWRGRPVKLEVTLPDGTSLECDVKHPVVDDMLMDILD